jgi:hypothetical protein
MFRLLRPAPVLLLLMSLSGCLVGDVTLTLKPNGAGSVAVTYSMDEDASIQLKGILSIREALALANDASFRPPPVDQWIDILANPSETHLPDDLGPRCKAAGIRLQSANVSSHAGRRNVQMTFAFSNITDLAKLDIFPTLGLELHADPLGNFVVRRKGSTVSSDLERSIHDPAYLEQIKPVLDGLELRIVFKSPTPLVATSGKKLDATRAEWTFSFEKDPRDVLRLMNDELSATFEGNGLTLPELH